MKILITGANGMVAKAVAKHCLEKGDTVIAVTREELDISNEPAVRTFVEAEKPEAVINCAAYTDVDGSEENRELCYLVNAKGAENLALAAKQVGCAFLTISTDYVFDGTKFDFYTQRDTPNPISVYGNAKLHGEVLARGAYARSIIVRTGWLFGHGGTNFLSTMGNYLADGKKVKAISNCFGTPTFVNDLAIRLRLMIEIDLPLIYHMANFGEQVSFYDFGLEICKLEDLDNGLIEKSSAESLQRAAKRPLRSGLRCLFSERVGIEPMPDWKASLKTFLSQKETQASEASNT